jgi:hypothetical protein
MKLFKTFTVLLSAALCVCSSTSFGQKQAKAVSIAFYNLENLFDTINDPTINDEEYTPTGSSSWTYDKYQKKLDHMSDVISQIGEEIIKGGPTVIGLSEVENRYVLEDLIKTSALRNSGYSIAHFDSPDRRGVDVALLYKGKDFRLLNAVPVPMKMPGQPDFKTRDQLVVTGLVDLDTITFVVNHWPSRGNDAPYRWAAATTTRSIVDSLFSRNKDAMILVMGDLNDDPVDPSLVKYLGAQGKVSNVKQKGLFNPMWQMYKDGLGSLAYKDSWNLFDQIIVSEPLIRQNSDHWKFYKARIFKKPFMVQQDGQYAGYPFRTFAGGAYTGGYSDHLPVYVILVKEKK